MSDLVDTDRESRLFTDPDLVEFMHGVEPVEYGSGLSRSRVLKLRSRLRLALYLVGGILVGAFILSRSAVDALTFMGLFALWVFLGIPACCKLER